MIKNYCDYQKNKEYSFIQLICIIGDYMLILLLLTECRHLFHELISLSLLSIANPKNRQFKRYRDIFFSEKINVKLTISEQFD